MATTSRLMTADELLRLPNDGCRHELVRGELRTMSPVGFQHGRITAIVTAALDRHVTSSGLGVVLSGEPGFTLAANPDTVRAPDVAFVRRERLSQSPEITGFWTGAPDLAVEVISPGDTYAEVEEKVFEWLDAGARMVVTVNPRRRGVTVYRSRTDIVVLTESDTLDGGDVVPGWSLRVADMFAQ